MSTPARRRLSPSQPAEPSRNGTVHLRAVFRPTAEKIAGVAQHLQLRHTHRGNLVAIKATADQVEALAGGLRRSLAPVEMHDVRVVFQPAGKHMAPADFLQAQSLAEFSTCARSSRLGPGHWLERMMQENRLTTHFQPIVHSRTNAVYGHECLLRGLEAGELVYAGELLNSARAAGLLFELDAAARRAALFASAERKIAGKIFINVSLSALYDSDLCLRGLLTALEEFGLHRDRCVLEVIESEHVRDIPVFRDVLRHYRAARFEVALDDLGPNYSSIELLRELRPDYIKLAFEAVHEVNRDSCKAIIAERLFESARALGVRTIAEGVESEGEYVWVREHGADFIQGFYCARPGSAPRSRLRPPASA